MVESLDRPQVDILCQSGISKKHVWFGIVTKNGSLWLEILSGSSLRNRLNYPIGRLRKMQGCHDDSMVHSMLECSEEWVKCYQRAMDLIAG
jgi:hypothetical protein